MPARRAAWSSWRFLRASARASLVLAGFGSATRRLATGRFGVASPFFGVYPLGGRVAGSGSTTSSTASVTRSADLRRNSDGTGKG